MNSTPAARRPRTAPTMSFDRQRRVLDAVAAVVLGEEVDLRLLEERPERLVVGELHARARIPHDDRLADPTRAALLLRPATSCVWKAISQNCSKPSTCSIQSSAGFMVWKLAVRWSICWKPNRLPPRGRAAGSGRSRGRACVAAPLDEAEGRVAERRGDREHRQRAAVVREALHVGDERPAALVEQPERPVDVLDVEHDGADPLGVLAQVAPGAPPFADRLVDDVERLAGAEGRRALPPLALELGAAGADLHEVELVDEEPPRPLEVVDVVVQRLDPLDPQRRAGHHPQV